MSWLGRGLGDFGSQVGQGFDIAQNWQQREQAMKMAAARQKLQDLLGPLQLQEIQQRLAQMNRPKPEGIISTPGGGTAGATFDPRTSQYGTQPLTPGADKEAVKQQIRQLAAGVPKDYQAVMESHAASIDRGEDPLKALEKAQQVVATAAGKTTTAEGKTRFKFEPEKGIITDKEGKEWSIYDPELPPDLQKLVGAEKKRKDEEADKKATLEAKKFAQQIDLMLKRGDAQAANEAYKNTLKVAQRGIAGHSFLKTVEDQTARAGAAGGSGTTSGDLLLIEGYMQLMFGVDPKALRGSPMMQQQLLKQGGVDDKIIAWWNGVKSGGKLDQSVRQEILESSKQQVGSFDQAVLQTGQLVDNPKVKDLTERYKRATGAGATTETGAGANTATAPPPPAGYVLDKK